MKKIICIVCLLFTCGCSNNNIVENQDSNNNYKEITFNDNEIYAVGYLGYNNYNYNVYSDKYLTDDYAIFDKSGDEVYLIVPRYENMVFNLYDNDITTGELTLSYTTNSSEPFFIICNPSDLYSNIVIEFIYNDVEYKFSPYISLKDGELLIGEFGKDITIYE